MSWKGCGIVGKKESAEGSGKGPEREVPSLLFLFSPPWAARRDNVTTLNVTERSVASLLRFVL
jgi:hypothetical protein